MKKIIFLAIFAIILTGLTCGTVSAIPNQKEIKIRYPNWHTLSDSTNVIFEDLTSKVKSTPLLLTSIQEMKYASKF